MPTSKTTVHIIGAGLAGSEAAHFLANKGVRVVLHEMRPTRQTEAHKTGNFAELVCSNSLKSKAVGSAPSLLKQEMREIDSLILNAADLSEVPAGDSLSVDREIFSAHITKTLRSHPLIEIAEGEMSGPVGDSITLIATGPLTSDALSGWIQKASRAAGLDGDLYFYDAIAPIIAADSIDMTAAFLANRYDKGGEQAYINCPMNKDEYLGFISALKTGLTVPPKNFEKEKFFQGCQPIEAIAATGDDTLRFGPMKPVGLIDPRTGARPYAAIQLRAENRSRTAYNMVGFQTKLKWPEQTRIFRTIPALINAQFLRMGSIHRNTFICGPKLLRGDLSFRGHPNVYFAGQITGVEGYLESASSGLTAAVFIWQRLVGERISAPPATSAMGAMLAHVTAGNEKDYQPNNIQFGLFDLDLYDGMTGLKKDGIREQIAKQSYSSFCNWWQGQNNQTRIRAN
jgi:methylenetetrahydrofolate--tRNA-(uracil-5-)-methyltransferase